MTEIPEVLRQVTVGRENGAAWLASLPGLVDELLQRWNCMPDGDPFSGKVGIVVPAKSAAYGDVVLKVSYPHPANAHEPTAYAIWQGHGAVRMFERDDEKYAMLLERVGPDRPVDALGLDDAIAAAGVLSRQLAVPGPPHLPRVSDQVDGWAATIGRLPPRLPAYVVDAAKETLHDVCHVQPNLMVHGDLHFNNVLRGVREPWQVIDPKGQIGDPASDAVTLLRTTAIYALDPDDYDPTVRRWVDIFAEAAELDREHLRRWTQMRAVEAAQHQSQQNRPQWIKDANDRIAVVLTGH